MATPIPHRQLFIDGEWKEPAKGKRIPIINPATETLIGDLPAATAVDVDLAVEAARRAFYKNSGRDWARASGAARAKHLRAIAVKIKERASELAKLEALDSGKPLDETAWDLDDVASCFEYYADLAESLDGKQKAPISVPLQTFKSYVLKEPIGVVGLITPWNYPLLMATWKVAPALAAGCTAVLKPSELASVTCLELAEVCKEVGLPPGVLNVLTGLGPEAGAPLASHPLVDKIAFTGSTETGRRIMTAAAQLIKPVSLELGGKSPLLVFEDVDIEKAVEWIAFGCFWTNGQICSATSRLLLQESIAKEFLDKLVAWTKNIKISDPLEEGCRLGPVVSEGQYEKIKKFVATARDEGATILCGGSRPKHLERGYFIEPTIISDVGTYMQIWREEVFGPVLCVKTFRSEEEAIELANDSQYGLAGAVISKDLERCNRITELEFKQDTTETLAPLDASRSIDEWLAARACIMSLADDVRGRLHLSDYSSTNPCQESYACQSSADAGPPYMEYTVADAGPSQTHESYSPLWSAWPEPTSVPVGAEEEMQQELMLGAEEDMHQEATLGAEEEMH